MNLVKNRGTMEAVELILQSCPSENGAAALAMVLSYYGKPAAMRELTRQPIASAADLVLAAQSRGIYAQGYRMSTAELRRAPLPLIAHWEFRSFVVVTGIRGEKVYVNSPEDGCQVLSRRAFEKGFTGVAICFANGETGQRSSSEIPRKRLWAGYQVPVLLAAAQLFIAAGYGLLAVLARSIAESLSSPQTGGGLSLCLEIGLVILLQGAAVAFQIRLIGRCRAFYHDRCIHGFQERLNRESTEFFQRTSRFRLDEAARGCAGNADAMARSRICLMQLVSGGVCLAVMAVQSLFAAAVALAVAAAFCGVCFFRREKLYSDGKLLSRAAFLGGDLAAQDLADWETNQLRGADTARFQRWACETGSAFRPMEMDHQKAYWYIAAAGELLLVFCVCLLEMIMGWSGAADLFGCMLLAAAAAASMGAFPCFMAEKMAERRCRESLGEVFQGEPEAHVDSGAGTAETLTVQNVSMRPAGEKTALVKDVTFTLRRGEILVVTGNREIRAALTAGIAGLERPAQGEFYLDQRSMADLSDREICGNITLLGGGIPFPHGTVRENIAAGLQNITDYAVMEAASDALLHRSVLRRTGGYDTPVSTLSSGERILLEFARAFSRGTPFLVCNGLTRELDGKTEDQLIRNMRRRGIGVVLLTEDAALLPKGDIACRIENGQTVLRERAEFVEEEVHGLV